MSLWTPVNSHVQPARHVRRRLTRVVIFGALFALGAAVLMLVPLLTPGQVLLNAGDVAPEDVRAPRSARYASDILTNLARDEAERNVTVQYDRLDPRVARQQIARARQMTDFIRAVRADRLATREQKQAALAAIEGVPLTPAVIDQLLDLSDTAWDRISQEIIDVIDLAMRDEIRDVTVDEVRGRLPALVAIELDETQTALVSAIARNFVVPNRARNDAATQAARDEARNQVEPRFRTIEAGQTIIRQGEVVTPLQIEALEELNLRQPQVHWGDVLGTVLVTSVLAGLLGLYLWRYEPELIDRPRNLMLLLLLLLFYLLAAKLMVPNRTVLPYLYPLASMSMLLAVLLGPGLAVTAAVAIAALTGVLSGGSLEIAVYAGAGSVVAGLVMGRVERLNTFFRAGLYVAVINVLLLLAFRLPAGATDPIGWVMLIGTAAINGGLSASLALGGIFLMGNWFDITTTLQLLELARPTHPLLNELLHQSSGTYHHTLMVANLAEQAAERIGANSLLTRVGAYYHDIGKMARPYMFVENQVEGANVHDQFDPRTSAEIIISHVTDGLELAKRYKLPARVRAFIPEHHGTMRANLLYFKAVEQSPNGEAGVDEAAFRYPGPKPQTKETALLMLADGCEAAVRATRPASPEALNDIVRKVIADRVAWGQLDECPLTLADLERTRESFVATLQGMFHPRLLYPGQARADQPTQPAAPPSLPAPAADKRSSSGEEHAVKPASGRSKKAAS